MKNNVQNLLHKLWIHSRLLFLHFNCPQVVFIIQHSTHSYKYIHSFPTNTKYMQNQNNIMNHRTMANYTPFWNGNNALHDRSVSLRYSVNKSTVNEGKTESEEDGINCLKTCTNAILHRTLLLCTCTKLHTICVHWIPKEARRGGFYHSTSIYDNCHKQWPNKLQFIVFNGLYY